MTDRESIDYVKRVIKNSEKVIFAGQPVNEVRLYTTDKSLEMLKRVVELADRKPCSDAIDRQAVFTTLDNMDKALDVDRTVENYKALLKECYKELPPVNPKVKTGHWINAKVGKLFPSNDFKCSECGNLLDFDGVNCGRGDANFCPNCGARMERD